MCRPVKGLAFTLAAAVSLPSTAVAVTRSTVSVTALQAPSTRAPAATNRVPAVTNRVPVVTKRVPGVTNRVPLTIKGSTTADTCSSVNIAPLKFTSVVTGGSAVKTIKSSTTISVTCAVGTPFSLLLNYGLHSNGVTRCLSHDAGKLAAAGNPTAVRKPAAAGKLTAPGEPTTAGILTYGLFQDDTRSIAWGDNTQGVAGVKGIGRGDAQQFVVYASVNVPAQAPVEAYSDSISVTVSY